MVVGSCSGLLCEVQARASSAVKRVQALTDPEMRVDGRWLSRSRHRKRRSNIYGTEGTKTLAAHGLRPGEAAICESGGNGVIFGAS